MAGGFFAIALMGTPLDALAAMCGREYGIACPPPEKRVIADSEVAKALKQRIGMGQHISWLQKDVNELRMEAVKNSIASIAVQAVNSPAITTAEQAQTVLTSMRTAAQAAGLQKPIVDKEAEIKLEQDQLAEIEAKIKRLRPGLLESIQAFENQNGWHGGYYAFDHLRPFLIATDYHMGY